MRARLLSYLFLLGLWGWCAPVVACECTLQDYSARGVRRALQSADAVFVGTASAVSTVGDPRDTPPRAFTTVQRRWRFVVAGFWKGSPDEVAIVVSGGYMWDTCAIHFELGQRYVVFANLHGLYEPGAMNTDICDYTTIVDSEAGKRALEALGPASEPHQPEMGGDD